MANLSHKYAKRRGRPFKGLRRASPGYRKRFEHGEPIAKIDTRPMVFVFAFIVIMMTVTVPITQHSVNIDIWDWETAHPLIRGSDDLALDDVEVAARLTLTEEDYLEWNGDPISYSNLVSRLRELQSIAPDAIVEFEPAANASYDRSAKSLLILKVTGARFRITRMEQYCQFANRWSDNGGGSLSIAHTVYSFPEATAKLDEYAQRFEPCAPLNHGAMGS